MPTVKVKLVKTVRLLPHQSVIATVHVDVQNTNDRKPLLLEFQGDGIVQSEDALLEPSSGGLAHLMISNPSGCPAMITEGTCIGEAGEAEAVSPEEININDIQELREDRCNSRYSLRPRINAPRRFHRGSSSGRALQEGGVM